MVVTLTGFASILSGCSEPYSLGGMTPPCLSSRSPMRRLSLPPVFGGREGQVSKLSDSERLHRNLDGVYPDFENLWTAISCHRRNR